MWMIFPAAGLANPLPDVVKRPPPRARTPGPPRRLRETD